MEEEPDVDEWGPGEDTVELGAMVFKEETPTDFGVAGRSPTEAREIADPSARVERSSGVGTFTPSPEVSPPACDLESSRCCVEDILVQRNQIDKSENKKE